MQAKFNRGRSGSESLPALAPWAAMVVLAWMLGGALYLTLPPSPDQFNLSYLGWRLISGDVPYVDFIDVNWPGILGLHALATWLFGIHLWMWRAFDFLLFAVSAIFLVKLVHRAAGPSAAGVCAVVSPLLYAGAGYWISGQPDMNAAQFLLVALWCQVRASDTRKLRWQLATGALLGAAMLCKPTVGVMLPLLAVQSRWLGDSWRTVAAQFLATTFALLATIALAVLATLQLGTRLEDLIDVAFVFTFANQYIDDAITKHRSLLGFLLHAQLGRWGALALAAVPAALWGLLRSDRSVATTALPLLWLTGVLSYFVQARGLPYHLAPSFIALAGLSAQSLGLLFDRARTGAHARLFRAALVGLGLVLLGGEGYRLAVLYRAVPGAWASGDSSRHLARFNANDGISVDDAVRFAQFAKAEDSSDCMLVVGNGSAINFLSQHRQPTRFYYFPVIARTLPPLPMAERWLALWASDLESANCRFALVSRSINDGWLKESSPAPVALRRFLDAYSETGTLGGPGGLVTYRRR